MSLLPVIVTWRSSTSTAVELVYFSCNQSSNVKRLANVTMLSASMSNLRNGKVRVASTCFVRSRR